MIIMKAQTETAVAATSASKLETDMDAWPLELKKSHTVVTPKNVLHNTKVDSANDQEYKECKYIYFFSIYLMRKEVASTGNLLDSQKGPVSLCWSIGFENRAQESICSQAWVGSHWKTSLGTQEACVHVSTKVGSRCTIWVTRSKTHPYSHSRARASNIDGY